jgi:hypothetical protein
MTMTCCRTAIAIVSTGQLCPPPHALLCVTRLTALDDGAGVLNVVHGTHEVVNRICDHPGIKAVSIVGSNAAGKHVYSRATAAGKRAQVCAPTLTTPRPSPVGLKVFTALDRHLFDATVDCTAVRGSGSLSQTAACAASQ